MLSAARDILALLEYTVLLQRAREEQILSAIRGTPAPKDFLDKKEREAADEIRRKFYTHAARAAVMPAEQAKRVSDTQDYQERSNALADLATFESHRLLASIPWVGDERYRDDGAPADGGETR